MANIVSVAVELKSMESLANTLPEAQKMLDAVKKAGVVHMICHNYRRVPAVMLAKQLIESGELGEGVEDLRPFDPRSVARAIAGLPE